VQGQGNSVRRRIVITAGECHVAREPELVIETILGSCVGLACHDAANRIGGLIHILLPEGTREKEQRQPCAYVRSGVPYLLARMEALGAERGRIRAHLAGGADMGTTRGEIDLHIGLRNVLAVMRMMETLAIPLEIMATGGPQGRTMRLVLADGGVEVTALAKISPGSWAGLRAAGLDDAALRRTIDELRPVSRIAWQAVEAARDPAASFYSIEQLVLRDQVLSASLFKLVNSAWYGMPRAMDRISDALGLIGLDGFRRLVMEACLHTFYARRLTGYAIEDGVLFDHALGCAGIAESIAQTSGAAAPEDAYLAGLVHDIGKVVLDRCASGRVAEVLNLMLTRNIRFYEAERRVLGVDHGHAGALLAAAWRLTPRLAEVIRRHHEPSAAPAADRSLVAVVHLADHICNFCGIGISSSSEAGALDKGVLSLLGLTVASVEEILNAVPSRLAFRS